MECYHLVAEQVDRQWVSLEDICVSLFLSCSYLSFIFVLSIFSIKKKGFTDKNANNFNTKAEKDDGSCVYCVYGCMDATACNYNPYATADDGSCAPPPECMECVDVGANNGDYGPNLEFNGLTQNDPACECIHVVAHKCNRTDITKDYGCMTIDGNDPLLGDPFEVEEKQVKTIPHPIDYNDFMKFDDITKRLINDKNILQTDVICVYPLRLDRGK